MLKTMLQARLFLLVLLACSPGLATAGSNSDSTPHAQDSRDIEKLKRDASAGDSEAQYLLGKAYHSGNGVHEDVDSAITYYRLAVQQEHPRAMNNLALLLSPEGSRPSPESIQLLRRAMQLGLISPARSNLAKFLQKRGEHEAAGDLFVEEFKATDGDTELESVARSYASAWILMNPMLRSLHPPANLHDKAISWNQRAADRGISSAVHNLAEISFHDGNLEQAVSLYERAWAMQVPQAGFRLGLMYNTGQGVAQDETRALDLFEASGALGYEPASKEAITRLLSALKRSRSVESANSIANRALVLDPEDTSVQQALADRITTLEQVSSSHEVIDADRSEFLIDFRFGSDTYPISHSPWKLFAISKVEEFDGLTLSDLTSTAPALAEGRTDEEGRIILEPDQAKVLWTRVDAGQRIVLLGVAVRVFLRPEKSNGALLWVADAPNGHTGR